MKPCLHLCKKRTVYALQSHGPVHPIGPSGVPHILVHRIDQYRSLLAIYTSRWGTLSASSKTAVMEATHIWAMRMRAPVVALPR